MQGCECFRTVPRHRLFREKKANKLKFCQNSSKFFRRTRTRARTCLQDAVESRHAQQITRRDRDILSRRGARQRPQGVVDRIIRRGQDRVGSILRNPRPRERLVVDRALGALHLDLHRPHEGPQGRGAAALEPPGQGQEQRGVSARGDRIHGALGVVRCDRRRQVAVQMPRLEHFQKEGE